MADSSPGTLQALGDGWASWTADELPGDVLIRFVEREGRRVPVTLLIEADDGKTVDANTLRKIPLGRVEAMANLVPSDDWTVSGLERAPRHMAEPLQKVRSASRQLARSIAKLKAAIQYRDELLEQPAWFVEGVKSRDFRVTPPPGRSHGDDFYRRVAEVYAQATTVTTRPAEVIATASHVPVTTVHRWVKEARRRGFLPPGRPGKAG